MLRQISINAPGHCIGLCCRQGDCGWVKSTSCERHTGLPHCACERGNKSDGGSRRASNELCMLWAR
eukprot:3725061-Pleurochrysis_carterae.AAC.2